MHGCMSYVAMFICNLQYSSLVNLLTSLSKCHMDKGLLLEQLKIRKKFGD